ncbi:MAG: hypothetical protein CMB99_02770 [Flavobacteriaceae bacterium]|nr:hypothetical protein [Flavobacteriaceae bacterium]|tara:strand:+ start:121784 stop:122632 length:849 start_codon:yes stop_codon:yes gene_type:complete
MKSTPKILVPLDFSKCSENAFGIALQLADKINGELLVMTVLKINDGGAMDNFAFVADDYKLKTELAEKGLEESIDSVLKMVRRMLDKEPKIDTTIEVGNIEVTICETAEKNNVDYIVMGTQGEVSMLDRYMGSVASNVISNAPCPVLAIPENASLPRNIILGYATNFSAADVFEIWKALKLFKGFHPMVKCVHFADKPVEDQEKMDELKEYFNEALPGTDVELYNLASKDKLNDMENFIKEEHVNFFVMFKPKRGFFESLFHKSWTKEMAMHATIPLLIFKD